MRYRSHGPLLASLVLLGATAVLPQSMASAARGPALRQLHFRSERQKIGNMFGLGTYIAKRYPKAFKPAVRRVARTGATWVREEFTASNLHSGPKVPYDFVSYDRVVDAELRHRLHILGLLDYNNSWHGHDHVWMGHAHIKSLVHDYVGFVKAVVAHYAHRIHEWQVWNEPDLSLFWKPFPNAVDYAYLLRETYRAIKSVNPHTKVVMAGPSGADRFALRYIHRVAAAGGRFDQVAMQPYTTWPGQSLLNQIGQLRQFHKPIWFTEIGWAGQARCLPCGSPQAEASKLATTYALTAVAGVAKVFWYDFRDDGLRQNYTDHFGLVEYNFAGKPTYLAYQTGAFFLDRALVAGVDRLSRSLTVYKLQKQRRIYYLAWNSDRSRWQTVILRWSGSSERVLSNTGQQVTRSGRGRLRLSVPPGSIRYVAALQVRPPARAPHGIKVPPGHTR